MAGKKKKGKVAIVIALKPMGGKAPKKPEDTSKVGVEKARNCKNCDCPKSDCVCKAGYC
jgi:hypothetical protein